MNFDDSSILKVIRFKCEKTLLFFTRYIYKRRQGRKFIIAEPHQRIAEALEKVLTGEIKKLIINVAPRYGKTELAVKNFIAHGLALNPAAKFIHLTYSAKLALDNSEEAKDIVTSDSFKQLFDVQIKKDSKAKDKWYTTAGGGVYAAATGGQVTGFGAGKVDEEDEEDEELDEKSLDEFFNGMTDFSSKKQFGGAIIIDDPIKPEDAGSLLKRTRINDRFETTIRNRVNSKNTPIIVIQQRVHAEDLSGYLMKVEPGEWTVLRLPCLKEDGTALWDLKHSVEELLKLKRINEYVFESQYQQNPLALKRGGEFYKKFTKNKIIKNPIINSLPSLYNSKMPLHISFDFNVHPYITLTIHQMKNGTAYQVDEICPKSPDNSTPALCRIFREKYKNHIGGLFIYGDSTGERQDTRDEKGQNDYHLILKELKPMRPNKRVHSKNPPVKLRGDFINDIFSDGIKGINILIGDNCEKTINDYLFLKENSEGEKLKETETDPATNISSQKYGHTSDANDYFHTWIFSSQFALYKSTGSGASAILGKNPETKGGY